MSLASGRLRHSVRLQYQEPVQDSDSGDITIEWVDDGPVWAEVAPLSAKEFIQSGSKQSMVVARITIRYRADVDATWRILHRGKVYNIEGVLADKESGLEYLTLPVSEGVSDEGV